MHRFINSLASTEYKKDLTAVEVDFKGFGSMQVYFQTMEIAASLVMLRKMNLWLLIKEDFYDLDAHHFLNFLKNWFKHPAFLSCEEACQKPCRIAIATRPECLSELKNAYRKQEFYNEIPRNIVLGIYADKETANAFLKQSYPDLQVYEHGESFNYFLN